VEGAEAAPIGFGAAYVLQDLGTERGWVREFALVTDAAAELDTDAAWRWSIERREKVRLDGHRVGVAESGARTNVRDGRPGTMFI
jgi:hypothetical protein